MLKKWYFCLSGASIDRENHGWRSMILAAVNSARINTDLKPILLYDGEENEFLDVLRAKGVEVIFHRVGFYDALKKRDETSPGYLSIASGAFLRTEIPLIETEDDYVLYTDCDVLFTGDVSKINDRPEYFSCAPQAAKEDYDNDANSGVLVINVKNMRNTYEGFAEFIVNNLNAGWPGCDQENYRRFYQGKWNRMPLKYNWKPYWGMDNNAEIIHWHGPKPEAILNRISNPFFNLYDAWEVLYEKNKSAYEQYFDLWDRYCDASLKYDYEGSPTVCGHVDSISFDDAGVLRLSGWSYLLGRSDGPVASLEVNGIHVEDCQRVKRPDVASAISSCSEYCGFSAKVSLPSSVIQGEQTAIVKILVDGLPIIEKLKIA